MSPKCNFLIRPCKPKWIERNKYETLSRCSKNFERDTYKGGREKHPCLVSEREARYKMSKQRKNINSNMLEMFC